MEEYEKKNSFVHDEVHSLLVGESRTSEAVGLLRFGSKKNRTKQIFLGI